MVSVHRHIRVRTLPNEDSGQVGVRLSVRPSINNFKQDYL